MFDTILVPLDRTRFAEAVLPAAMRLARATRGRLHLLLAHQPAAALVGMGEVPVHPGLDLELQDQEGAYLGWIGWAPVRSRPARSRRRPETRFAKRPPGSEPI
jgi:nucleotide-binding universal stress UspA family protein